MTRPFLLGLFALSALGCALRPRYADVSAGLGVTRALEERVVDDGEAVHLYAVDPSTEAPVAGLSLSVWAPARTVRLTTDAAGHARLPVSRQMLKDNSVLDVQLPRGVGQYALRAGLSCECEGAGGALLPRRKLLRWPQLGLGPDRLYAPKQATSDEREQALLRLGQLRAALGQAAGLAPPPIAAVLGRPRLEPDGADEGGRPWAVLDLDPEGTASFLHAWAHELLWRGARLAGDDGTRYLEEGLARALAQRAQPTEALAQRALAALEAGPEGEVDLVAASRQHAPLLAAEPAQANARRCGDEGARSRALAFAYGLELLRLRADLVAQLAAALSGGAASGAGDLVGHLARLAPGAPDPQHLDVAWAKGVLRAHAGVNSRSPPPP